MKQNNQALSLILTLLIISSLLTGTVMVGDILIRHGQIVKGTEISEVAYFAAESAMEKATYEILQNYKDISYTLSGSLDNDSEYSVTSVTVNKTNPSTGATINAGNPWEITLSAKESFHLNLDINGAIYPTSLTIDKSGNIVSDLLIYECTTLSGPPRVCSSTAAQVFKVTFPYILTITASTKYYKIRINNLDSTFSETYTLTPNNDLPIGIDISVNGTYSGYERQIKSTFPKWQTFGI